MIDLSSFDLHIFDLDDTLITTKETYWFAQAAAIHDSFPDIDGQRLERLVPRLKWLCRAFGSGNVKEYMAAFLASEPELFASDTGKLNDIVARYHVLFESRLSCYEGAFTLLEKLISAGKSIAIVSNGNPESQYAKLQNTGLASYFPNQRIYVSGQYPKPLAKPSPHMVVKACCDADSAMKRSVFYGNSEVDMVAGNLAGVFTGHFSATTQLADDLPDIALPDFAFQSWSELLP